MPLRWIHQSKYNTQNQNDEAINDNNITEMLEVLTDYPSMLEKLNRDQSPVIVAILELDNTFCFELDTFTMNSSIEVQYSKSKWRSYQW